MNLTFFPKQNKQLILTAALGVSTEFLVREFRHLLSSFRGSQHKAQGKSKPQFKSHVFTSMYLLMEKPFFSAGKVLVFSLLVSLFGHS